MDCMGLSIAACPPPPIGNQPASRWDMYLKHFFRTAITIAFLYLSFVTPSRLEALTVNAPVEVYGGVSYFSLRPTAASERLNLPGWQSTVTDFRTNRLGFAADFGGNYGDRDQHSFLEGPQIRLFKRGRIESSFRAFFETVRSIGETAFGNSFGGGLDIRLTPRIAWRLQPGIFLTHDLGDLERNFRFSTGLVFRIGGRP